MRRENSGRDRSRGGDGWKKAVLAVMTAAVFLCAYFEVFFGFDHMLSDPLYQTPTPAGRDIKIIAIDEKTLAQYGPVSGWSREIYARLIDLLTGDPAYAPAVIGMDILFAGEGDAAGDAALAQAAARAGCVVTVSHFIRQDQLTYRQDQRRLLVERDRIAQLEVPYPALRQATTQGFANAAVERDGYIRSAMLQAEYEGETLDSFAWRVYRQACAAKGMAEKAPETYGDHLFSFTYSGPAGSYETLSLCNVLEGRVDTRAFAGKIVLLGAYAPGMQDDYFTAMQRGQKMYGVEIHANILEALLEGKTGVPASRTAYALVAALSAAAFWLLLQRAGVKWGAPLLALFCAADVLLCAGLYRAGLILPLVYPVLAFILLYAVQLAAGYFAEVLRRRRVLSAFKKYVAPQVVDELSRRGEFKITLGGEARDIAVLFVDIRGFTPLSEALEPEQVVEILNEYLDLTTRAIFRNKGTLDKFVGDATMAIFNAPVDLDDYVYRAVCTARDITEGAGELTKRLEQRFGRTVGFGVGVNCGRAVVGNIGNQTRMDYTAIGDTVNTAARLEANAGAGQILISQAVADRLQGRIETEPLGEIPLKGKSKGVAVYRVVKVR